MSRLAFFVLAALSLAPAAGAAPISVTVNRIEHFALRAADEPKAPLEFLGGINVESDNKLFGGLSGIDMLDPDTAFIISDFGVFVRARLVHENGRLVGLADAELDTIFPNGEVEKDTGDVEDVALDPTDRQRGVIVRERQTDAMLAFDLKDGRPENFKPIWVGIDSHVLRSNKGLESVAYAPATSPVAGRIVTIEEHPGSGQKDFAGWIVGVGGFTLVRHDDFDVSSARFLPNGDLLVLERRYAPGASIAIRIRRIPGATLKVHARVDGDTLLEAGLTYQIDNLEGLAVSRDAQGRTILTLVSDDNYSLLQRTLILQFALVAE